MGQYPDTPEGRSARQFEAESRLEIVNPVITALDNRPRLFAIVEEATDADDAHRAVVQEFGFTKSQAEIVLDLQVRRFSKTERRRIAAEREQLLHELESARRTEHR